MKDKIKILLIILCLNPWWNIYATEEIWLLLSPELKYKNLDIKPELHFRNIPDTGHQTKAAKVNLISGNFIFGAAYFDFPLGVNERRLYGGGLNSIENFRLRYLVEGRQFNDSRDEIRLRNKIDYEIKNGLGIYGELLFQFGTKQLLESRSGFLVEYKLGTFRSVMMPSLFLGQDSKPRYVLIFGEFF